MAALNTSLWRFFALSVALHVLAVLLLYPIRPRPRRVRKPSPFRFCLTRKKSSPRQSARPALRQPVRQSADCRRQERLSDPFLKSPLNRSIGRPTVKTIEPSRRRLRHRHRRAKRCQRKASSPNAHCLLKRIVAKCDLSSSSPRDSGPISLNTKDPVYVSYFNKIKQLIESQWEYPELALRYGLQGRLALQFVIGGNGRLEQLRLVRSSGSQLLDDEALRAIKAAAPFPPIPPWIKPSPLFRVGFHGIHDNRLNYRFSQ